MKSEHFIRLAKMGGMHYFRVPAQYVIDGHYKVGRQYIVTLEEVQE